MFFKIFICFLKISVLGFSTIAAQLSGKIILDDGTPASFATVVVNKTSSGTIANVDGEYQIELKPGRYTILFQYLGYKTKIIDINVANENRVLDVVLEKSAYELGELIVAADREDPAYPIIRKAQKQRLNFKNEIPEYSCKVYIKGVQKLLDTPQSIMGIELGDLGGVLDSNRQGIVYLSESLSTLYIKGDRVKEIMNSSKVSGSDRGYSFNNALQMQLNFYDATVSLGRDLVSPIAPNAFAYYKYKLVGVDFDEGGRLINKIEVIPLNEHLPAFQGFIYIVEDTWRIHSIDLTALKDAAQVPFVDSILIRQQYIPLNNSDAWVMFANNITFRLSGFGFVLRGYFNAIYTDYDTRPISNKIFNSEILSVEKSANDLDKSFFDSIRPIPLTKEEELDYSKKDSLQIIKRSDAYRDSLDAIGNKFRLMNLLTGYTYRNSKKKINFTTSSLFDINYNTVNGTNLDLRCELVKRFTGEERSNLSVEGILNYSFEPQELRPMMNISWMFDPVDKRLITLSFGHRSLQFNEEEPISPTKNTFFTYFFRRNFMKIYDTRFVQLAFEGDLSHSTQLGTSVKYAHRSQLFNRYGTSLFYEGRREFSSNNPNNILVTSSDFEEHRALTADVSISYTPKTKVVKYPNRKIKLGSKWPTFTAAMRKAFAINEQSPDFTLLQISIEGIRSLRTAGTIRYFINGGSFLSAEKLYFMDVKHFLGNQTHLGYINRYDRQFFLLDYYFRSTQADFLQAHVEYNSGGWILDRIPGVRKLKLHLIFSYKTFNPALRISGNSFFHEFAIGLDRLGIGDFRLFRLDVVYQNHSSNQGGIGLVLGTRF